MKSPQIAPPLIKRHDATQHQYGFATKSSNNIPPGIFRHIYQFLPISFYQCYLLAMYVIVFVLFCFVLFVCLFVFVCFCFCFVCLFVFVCFWFCFVCLFVCFCLLLVLFCLFVCLFCFVLFFCFVGVAVLVVDSDLVSFSRSLALRFKVWFDVVDLRASVCGITASCILRALLLSTKNISCLLTDFVCCESLL